MGHADDLLYLFPSKDSLTTEDDRQMSSLMVKLFTNFANTGSVLPLESRTTVSQDVKT